MPEDALEKQFTASFSVDSPGAHDSAWQQFPEQVFASPARASNHALEIAKDSIDRHISDSPFPNPNRGRFG